MPILVVDDSPTIRTLVRRELNKGGYDVLEAASGEEALQYLQQTSPELITLDVVMPGMDGFEFCDQLRSGAATQGGGNGASETPIVFLTASDTLEQRERGFQVGATDFITKPFLSGELLTAVKRILEPQLEFSGAKAVVIDDSGVIRRVIGKTLAGLGVEVLEADHGAAGLKLIQAHAANLDLVITDMIMPEMDGGDLCKAIRGDARFKELPVIVVSGVKEKERVLDMFRAGVTDYLVKPFPMEELVARVSVHLRARRLNRELARNVDELKSTNRLKDKFLAITSHDLRSPLTGILGFSDLILEDIVEPEQQKDFIRRIRDSGNYLLELINDLLDLSRLQAQQEDLDLSRLSLLEVTQSALETIQHMATPKGIELELVNRCPAPPFIQGDRNALMRIMNNLISNAVKFTGEEGKVSVVVEPSLEGLLTVSVLDTGIGIPEQKMPELFDAYSKSSQAGTAGEKGTGLGMNITKHLVEQHNGSISVSSQVGVGTKVTLTFPQLSKS